LWIILLQSGKIHSYLVEDKTLLYNFKRVRHIYNQTKSFESLLWLSVLYLQMNKLQQAVEMITLACQVNKNNKDAALWRGIIFYIYLYSKRA
jgi:hypothetical protein